MFTEDVGVFEIDGFVFDRVARVEQHLALPVELDGVGGFVDAIAFDNEGLVFDAFGFDALVFLVHVLDVVHGSSRGEGEAARGQLPDCSG